MQWQPPFLSAIQRHSAMSCPGCASPLGLLTIFLILSTAASAAIFNCADHLHDVGHGAGTEMVELGVHLHDLEPFLGDVFLGVFLPFM